MTNPPISVRGDATRGTDNNSLRCRVKRGETASDI